MLLEHVRGCSNRDCRTCHRLRCCIWRSKNPLHGMLLDVAVFGAPHKTNSSEGHICPVEQLSTMTESEIVQIIMRTVPMPPLLSGMASEVQVSCAGLAYDLHLKGKSTPASRAVLSSTLWFKYKSVFSSTHAQYLNEVLKIGFRMSSTRPDDALFDVWRDGVMQQLVIHHTDKHPLQTTRREQRKRRGGPNDLSGRNVRTRGYRGDRSCGPYLLR
jgi:hypothetical protein